MGIQEVIELINKKIAEHSEEAIATTEALESFKVDKENYKDVDRAMKYGVLNHKRVFHRAATMVLNDLLKDISDETKA